MSLPPPHTPAVCPTSPFPGASGWSTWLGPESASPMQVTGGTWEMPHLLPAQILAQPRVVQLPHITSPWRPRAWPWCRGRVSWAWLPHLLLLGCPREEANQSGRPAADSTGRKECTSLSEYGTDTRHAPPPVRHGGVAGPLLPSFSPAQPGISTVHTQLTLYLAGLGTAGNGTRGRVRGYIFIGSSTRLKFCGF